MMNKQKSQPFCMFDPCRRVALSKDEELSLLSRVNSPKKVKTSLRKAMSKPSVLTQSNSKVYSPPSTVLERVMVPVVQQKPQYFVQYQPVTPQYKPATPKPKIKFSWNVDLAQTRKKEPPIETPKPIDGCENELKKTKSVKNVIRNLTDNQNMYKASVISIQDVSPKMPPKVEESVIMVDYFNPTNQQKSKLDEYLETRSKDKEVLQ